MSDKSHCCHHDCMKDAEFFIYGVPGHWEDTTEACGDHVGALLGTPAWLTKENESWNVYPIEVSDSYRRKGQDIVVTIWSDGKWEVWGAMDAHYAKDTPGYLTTVSLKEILRDRSRPTPLTTI